MSTYDFEPDPGDYGPEPPHIANSQRTPQPTRQEPVAWVWNPAKEAWEKVHVFGHWQQGATYSFGPTMPAAPQPAQRTPEETLDWLADQHRAQCGEDRPIQEWMRKMKEMLP